MTDSDIDDVAAFMLRHFRERARVAALDIEIEAAQGGETDKSARWQEIGTRIQALECERGLAAFAAPPPSRRRRRISFAKAAATVRAEVAVAPLTQPTRVPWLRVVVS